MRYVVPILFFAAAGFVWHYNSTHDSSWLLVPFLDLVPSLAGDLDGQAEWTWRILAGLGGVLLLWTIGQDVRGASRRREQRDAADD